MCPLDTFGVTIASTSRRLQFPVLFRMRMDDCRLSARKINTMTTPISRATVPSPIPDEQDLHRQLIQQFYENSIERYGPDSEQTQMFAQHLSAYAMTSE
jgi:hypothetical protein